MKAVIFLNGEYDYKREFVNGIVNKGDVVFCGDGGANYAYIYGIKVDYVIGDLDSINPIVYDYYKIKGSKVEKHNPEKDYTDFELILHRIKEYQEERGIIFEDVYILGGLGKRLDMTLNNLHLLEEYKNMTFFSCDEEVFYRESTFTLKGKKGQEFSIIPVSDSVEGLTLRGFKYSLYAADIERKSSKLVSNIIVSDECSIDFIRGKIIDILRKKI